MVDLRLSKIEHLLIYGENLQQVEVLSGFQPPLPSFAA
jgi:hypothetical protein